MQKIDIGSSHKTLNTSSTSGTHSGAATSGLRRTGRVVGVEAKRRMGQFLDRMKMRRVSSAVQTSDQDVAPVSKRNHEQLISDLSRMLVQVQTDLEGRDATEIDMLFKAMLNENIRRLVLMERARGQFMSGIH